jgi:molybdate transport system substrate-binding protein
MTPARHLSLLSIIILCLFFAACGETASTSPPITLRVFAAASLTNSLKTIAERFHKAYPMTTVTFNFAGSQLLEQQIANGAPADVFASADLTNMQKATDARLVQASQIFAKNKLAVIIPANNPAGIKTLQDLAKPGTKIDIGAESVPAGKYTLEVLDKMAQSPDYGQDYKKAVLGNVVSHEDNVKAVVQKVVLGEVDAGFVYQTDVTASASKKVTMLPIPDSLNVIAQYPIAVVKKTTHPTEAETFVQYILSENGQAVFDSYHFLRAQP